MYNAPKTALAPAHFISLKGLIPSAILSRVFQLADEVSYLQSKQ